MATIADDRDLMLKKDFEPFIEVPYQIKTIQETVGRIETHVAKTNGKVADQEKELQSIRIEIGNEPLKKQYASKLTEKLMFALVAIILIGVVGQWMNIIMVKSSTEKINKEVIAESVEEYLGDAFKKPIKQE